MPGGAPRLLEGERLGCRLASGFQLLARLAGSLCSEVWLAEHLGAALVVKRCTPEAGGQGPERLATEAAVLRRVEHPNVVALVEAGEDLGGPFIALPYLRGEDALSLLRLAQAGGATIPQRVAARVGADAALGLEAIHAGARAIHGDVSPSNLFVTYEGRTVVIDLGSARAEGSRPGPTVAAKAAYLAPEVLEGAPADRRSDVFSLAATLVELVTGRSLFGRDTLEATRAAVAAGPPATAARGGPDLVPPLAQVLTRALARSPAERQQSAVALALDLVPHAAEPFEVAAWIQGVVDPGRRATRSSPLSSVHAEPQP